MGDPNEFSQRYFQEGVDEIIYIDSVASLYNRDILKNIVVNTTKNVFIPLTVGGGVRTVDDAHELLQAGADKICVNTGVVKNPVLIADIATRFGSQCMVLSIEAKKITRNRWQAYIDNGREPTGLDVIEWAKNAADKGAGEILLTSIDQEGTTRGFDLELIRAVSSNVRIPVIVSGGLGTADDFVKAVNVGGADAVAVASTFHYKHLTAADLRRVAEENNIPVRKI